MRRDWLLYLVIFSLALNLGTIATFTYVRYQDMREAEVKGEPGRSPGHRELWAGLQLDQEQRAQVRKLRPEHRRRVMSLRRDLARKREELFTLIKGDAVQWPQIQGKIREISALQEQLEEEVVRFLLDFKQQLKPQQLAAFYELMERRLDHTLGGRGRGGPPGLSCPPGSERGPGPGVVGPPPEPK
jgi:Spy/CpxP family protein refolding chaperone